MPLGKTPRRMTLLQLLVHTEKYTHDLREQFRVNFWPSLSEFHDMSRPVRKRSGFPTLVALRNGLERVLEASKDLEKMVDNLATWTDEILDHARREQARR
jgi:hypothetical protein